MKQKLIVLALASVCIFAVTIAVQAQQTKAPGVVILKGNPMGGVKFDHAAHVKLAGDKCVTCHHASKPAKLAQAAQENCQKCHTKAVKPPMKTNAKLAFHDNTAKSGTCINCHTKAAKAGKKNVPLKCTDCHQKANV